MKKHRYMRIVELPEQLKEKVNIMLSNPMKTYSDISLCLREKGFNISKSAIGRYDFSQNLRNHQMKGAENMYDKDTFYNFINDVQDKVLHDLKENNKEYCSCDEKVDQLWDSLFCGPKEIQDNLMVLEEAFVQRANIMDEAMYLKGFEDGFALISLMSQGCIIKKYSEFTNKEIIKAG